jgi:urea transport system permease protein
MSHAIRWLLCVIILQFFAAVATAQSDDPRAPILAQLLDRSFDVKTRAIDQLAAFNDARTRSILTAMLAGDLYHVKNSSQVVIATSAAGGLTAFDAITGAQVGQFGKRELQKVTVNNALRTRLRALLAGIDLTDPDRERRLSAIQQILGDLDDVIVEQVAAALAVETDDGVREAMHIAIALYRLGSDQPAEVVAAVELLESSVNPTVRGRLARLAAATDDDELRQRIELGLKRIDSKLSIYAFIEKLFFGLSLGSVLVLAAIGLAITFGVMGVINMAHGELIMIGAYTTYVVQQIIPSSPGVALLLSVPLAFIVAGLAGVAIERSVIRFLYGRPLETLLATFGISLILQQAVRSIFSPLNRSVTTPDWLSGSIQINEALSLTMNRLSIIVFCLVVFAGLSLVLKRTALGLQVRAVSQNRDMARAMGVRSARVDALTFGLGSGIAGIAGVALSQLTNVGPNLGQAYIIDSFMVVVFGGVGNLWGTLLGGMSLGVINKFLEPWAGAVLAKIVILVLLILFIQKRPRGLFPQRGRAAE